LIRRKRENSLRKETTVAEHNGATQTELWPLANYLMGGHSSVFDESSDRSWVPYKCLVQDTDRDQDNLY